MAKIVWLILGFHPPAPFYFKVGFHPTPVLNHYIVGYSIPTPPGSSLRGQRRTKKGHPRENFRAFLSVGLW